MPNKSRKRSLLNNKQERKLDFPTNEGLDTRDKDTLKIRIKKKIRKLIHSSERMSRIISGEYEKAE